MFYRTGVVISGKIKKKSNTIIVIGRLTFHMPVKRVKPLHKRDL